jgi:hypothetical protein
VFTVTGITANWIAAPGDRVVNLDKQSGLIFIDPKKITTIYKKGKVS